MMPKAKNKRGDMKTIKVVMPAHMIPDGSTVYKKTGTYRHTLKTSLLIYLISGKNPKKIKHSIKNSVFLIGHRGGINEVKGDIELIWDAPECEILGNFKEIFK